MTEQQHHEHTHHHHHHQKDGASKFKQKSLAAIHRRKVIEKVLKYGLIIIAVFMAILVIAAYVLER